VAGVVVPTDVVVTLNVAVALPPLTKTEVSGWATPLLLDRLTWIPGSGARPFKVTVPCETLPPITLVGCRITDDNASAAPGVTVSEELTLTLL
jgi:hypothetical protein